MSVLLVRIWLMSGLRAGAGAPHFRGITERDMCPEQEGKYVPVQRFEHGLEEVEALELVYEKRVLLLVSGILDRPASGHPCP